MQNSQLARDGGTPVRTDPLPSVMNAGGRRFGDDEVKAVERVLRSGMLSATWGTEVPALELEFASLLGAGHAVACSSGTAALHLAVAAVNPEPGDEIITTPISDMGTVFPIMMQNAVPVFADVDPVTGNLTPETVAAAITPRTKAILIGSPANPTGAVQPRAALEALVALAEEHDLYLVSDEIYDRLTYTGGHTCLGTLPGARERTVLLGGFSKAHAMTGWRVGWICAPAPVAELAVRVHQYTMLCAPHVSQLAAVEALSAPDDEVDAMVADYDRRRRVFVKGLRETGLECPEPGGAFYAFPSIRSSGLDSETFAERLLHAEHVAVVPGSVFGPSGEGHIRCSYATALPLLEEALVRIDRFLRTQKDDK